MSRGPAARLAQRWWLLRAFGRHPLIRPVDRVHGWAVLIAVAVLVGAALVAGRFADDVYAQRLETFATEAATRHPVDAVAVHAQRVIGDSTPLYSVRVRWTAAAGPDRGHPQERTLQLDHAVADGQAVHLWVDDRNDVTRAPRTHVDAGADAFGAAVAAWSVALAIVLGALTAVRRALDRRRHRAWDADLLLLVGDGGGRATR